MRKQNTGDCESRGGSGGRPDDFFEPLASNVAHTDSAFGVSEYEVGGHCDQRRRNRACQNEHIVVHSQAAKDVASHPPASMAAAMVAVPTQITVATRTPARITPRARGNSTWKSSWRSVIPMPRPASRIAGSTPLIPVKVLRMIGSSA